MPAGEPFDDRQVRDINEAVRQASVQTGVNFSVFVGRPQEDPREYAERAHSTLVDARHSVLVLVAPDERRIEIVTGTGVRHRLTDRDCALAALSMASSFAGGDLAGGIVLGLQMLSERAGRPRHARA